jgi:hypothetical protein
MLDMFIGQAFVFPSEERQSENMNTVPLVIVCNTESTSVGTEMDDEGMDRKGFPFFERNVAR